jgi:hypothetical protein
VEKGAPSVTCGGCGLGFLRCQNIVEDMTSSAQRECGSYAHVTRRSRGRGWWECESCHKRNLLP